MSEQIRVLLSEEELDRKIAELGERISKDYEGESVHLICILREVYSLPVNWQSVLPCR